MLELCGVCMQSHASRLLTRLLLSSQAKHTTWQNRAVSILLPSPETNQ